MALFLLLIGFVSILGQVALLRELSVAAFGVELIYILAIGVWLAGTAMGAAIGRKHDLPSRDRIRAFFLLVSILVPLDVAFIRAMRAIFSDVPGAYLPFGIQMLAMAIALLPIGVLLGLLFQWAARRAAAHGRTLAFAYAVESAGGCVGGLAATLFLTWGIQNFATAMVCALVAAFAVFLGGGVRSTALRAAGISLAGLLLLGLWKAGPIDQRLASINHPSLAATRDTPYGRATVTMTENQVAVFENDALSYESGGTAAEEFAHLSLLQHPRPATVLILGGGFEGLVREVLRHNPSRIDYVELNGPMLELILPHMSEENRSSLEAEDVNVHVADPRRFLRDAGRYDLILIGMPEPASGAANRFYTEEFFAQCLGHLGRDGIIAMRLPSSENLWSPSLLNRTAGVTRALRSSFSDVVVLPGTTNIVLASRSPLIRDPAVLSDRLAVRAIGARLVTSDYIRYLYTNDRFAEIALALSETSVPINSDLRPICYHYTLTLWLSAFYPTLERFADPSATGSSWVWVTAGLVALATVGGFIAARRRSVARRALLVAVAGFSGMVLESVFILTYQVTQGVLYKDIGLLLTLFMAGLGLGAFALDRLATKADVGRGVGWGLIAGLAAVAIPPALALHTESAISFPVTAGLLFGSGALVAGLFAYASLKDRPDQRRMVSPLYAADLVGGCVGSLVGALFLIPVAGFAGAAIVVCGLAVVALMLA